MPSHRPWYLLNKDLPADAARYALIDCAATAGFADDDEIYNRLEHPDVQKYSLFTGQNAWTIGRVAPCLVPLDGQPELCDWIFENGRGRNWAVFLASPAPVKTILAHFRHLFDVETENGRKVFFRCYDPVILGELLPLLDMDEAAAFFGPVLRFVMEDGGGRPLVFQKPQGRDTRDLDPVKVIVSKRHLLSAAWNRRLLDRHIETYGGLGLEAVPEPDGDALTLTDKTGARVRLEKTAAGAAATTGEGRLFQYELTRCKHPAQIVDPAGTRINIDIQQRQNGTEPLPGENLVDAIRLDDGRKTYVFEYDDMDHLGRIDYPDGSHAAMVHDTAGRLCRFTDRNGHTTNLRRDFDGRLTRLVDANGHTTRFDYQELTAPSRIAFADGTTFDFTYAAAGELEQFFAADQLAAGYRVDHDSGSWRVDYADGTRAEFEVENQKIVRAVNAAGTLELSYDDAGHLASETFAGRTVTYHRNAAGDLTGITTPFGQRIEYARDKENRVRGISDWQGRTIEIGYGLSGALETVTCPNGARLSQRSTAGGLPAELRLDTPTETAPVFHQVYRRDELNRVTQVIDGDRRTTYGYDAQGRLTAAQYTGAAPDESFTLDAKANRLRDRLGACTVNPADKIVQAGQNTFSYDALGNLTQTAGPGGAAAYGFTSLNRLTSLECAGARAEYQYDALGRRVLKKVGDTITRFVWAGGQLLHEITWQATGAENAAEVTDYLFFPQRPVLLAMRRPRQTFWAAWGQRYEVLALTDATGRCVWQADYDAFGTAQIGKGRDLFQPWRLCGQYHDAESGLSYNLARYYDPRLGRYLSLDPLFLEGGGDNFYAYCNGDPINRIDPSGEFIFCAILIGAAIGAAIAGGLEAWQEHAAGKGLDGFKIARAALLGGVIGAVGGGVGAAVEAAMATAAAGTALSSGTLAGMAATGFLSGTAGSVAEQCAQAAATGGALDPMAVTRQALTDGVVGAGIGLVTLGAGGFLAKRLKKAARAFVPELPAQRSSTLLARAKAKTRKLAARVKSAGARKSGRSNEFCVGDPVDPVTGETVLEQTDFTLTGRMPLAWTRHYGSQNDYAGLLGPGWQSPADARLEIDDQGLVTFYDGSPGAAVFEALPENEPVMEAAGGAVLQKVEGACQVRLKSGLIYYFGTEFHRNRSPVIQISDPQDHFLRFVHRDGELISIADDSGRKLQVTCENGRIVQISQYQKPLVRYLYQGGALIGAMDPLGHQKRYEYDSRGRLSRHMDKNKLSFHYTYDDNGRCIRAWGDGGLYDYSLDHRPLERQTRVTDSRGRVRTFVYDQDRLPLTVIDHDGATTAYAYDDVGRVTQVIDPLGRSTQYDYDDAGNVTQIIRPDDNRIAIVYDNDHRPIQLLDANGKIWEQRFDALGRLIEKIDPLDGRTAYTYTAAGDLETLRDKEGHLTRFQWDEHGHLIAATDPAGRTARYQRDLRGNITAAIDPAGSETRYIYDDKSRLCQVVRSFGHGESFVWDPEDNLLEQIDALGNRTRFEYGGLNEIARRINADGTSVSYTYDSEENLVGVTNERGQTYRFEYDLSGRVTRRTDYFGNATGYRYDPAGQLIRTCDPLERIITYAYDAAGRLTAKTFESEEQETFKWGANGNLIAFDCPGAHVQRFFDAAGNLAAERDGGVTIEYRYDKNGRRIERKTSHGNQVRYTYDPAGAVSEIQINDQQPVTIARDDLGRITEEHFSRHLQRTIHYNEEGMVSYQGISTATNRIERRYAYDPAGNLLSKSDSHKGPWNFSYDPLGRIAAAMDPEQQVSRFNYDPAGDLLEHLPDTGHGLRTARHQGTEYRYNAAGNLTQRQTDDQLTRFDFDEQNRLTTVRLPDDSLIRMTYDALGRRRIKATNGQRTFFAWDGDTLLSEQFEDGPVREYVYYPGTFEPLAAIDGNGQVYYYHNDINGLPQELTRPNGDIVWSATYDALGKVQQLLVDEVVQPLRLQGQYFDQETGLCYNRHRYFDPQICSFISQDPIGLAGGENVYAYAPNAWGWVDPLGLKCKNTANIYHYPGSASNPYGHYSIETISKNESLHTHQVITELDRSNTKIVNVIDSPPSKVPDKIVEVKLPNTEGAQSYQKSMIGRELGPYDQKTNSCIDHVSEVLRAGGTDIPKSALGQYRYLRGIGF